MQLLWVTPKQNPARTPRTRSPKAQPQHQIPTPQVRQLHKGKSLPLASVRHFCPGQAEAQPGQMLEVRNLKPQVASRDLGEEGLLGCMGLPVGFAGVCRFLQGWQRFLSTARCLAFQDLQDPQRPAALSLPSSAKPNTPLIGAGSCFHPKYPKPEALNISF